MTLRINLWSGPRNISTAVMYAFAQRADTRVIDEPLYAHYLRVSGARHPGWEDVIAAQDGNGRSVIDEVVLGRSDRPVLFLKQMAHHLVDLEWGFMAQTANVLLIRDPADVLRTITRQVPHPGLEDIGIGTQAAIFDYLRGLGQDPPVLDARLTLQDPESVLRELCSRLDLGFEPAMMRWDRGGRSEDGVWAPHWYHVIHQTTGFTAYREKTDQVPCELGPVLDEARPHYRRLLELAIGG